MHQISHWYDLSYVQHLLDVGWSFKNISQIHVMMSAAYEVVYGHDIR